MAEELDTFDTMLSSLVEILEQKGILTQEEWEKKIKSKIDKGKINPVTETYNLASRTVC